MLFTSFAGAEISTPLNGYFRPGRYLPVHFTMDRSPGATLVISGEGAAQTRIALGDATADGIAPFLVTGPLRNVRWQLISGKKTLSEGAVESAWRPLAPTERLVGITSIDSALARKLFDQLFADDDVKVQSIRLPSGEPLPGPAAAWDALDAVVLDAADRLDEEKLPVLLASGMIVAVRSQNAPDSRWPWRRVEIRADSSSAPVVYWSLRHEIRGPRISEINPDAFRSGFEADWPRSYRIRVILYAAVFSILIVGAVLLRGRLAAVAALIISAATVAGLAWWWHGRAPVRQQMGTVTILRQRMAQTDLWSQRCAVGRSVDRVEFRDLLRVLFSPEKGMPAEMSILCREDGQPMTFEYRTTPGMTIALVWRSVGVEMPQAKGQVLEPSQLQMLVKDAYRPRAQWKLSRIAPPGNSAGVVDLGQAVIEAR